LYKVLIVDDFIADRENLKCILDSFSDFGVEVVSECENGEQALEETQKSRPDIIICDIEMPFMDGFEQAKAVRGQYPEIKIIFCTLYKHFEYARKALYLDGYGYILKPVNPDELKECIVRATGIITNEWQRTIEYENLKSLLHESMPVLIEDFFKGLLYGLNRDVSDIWDRIGFLGLNIKDGNFVLSLVEIDGFNSITHNQSIEQREVLSLKIFGRVKEILTVLDNSFTFRADNSHFVILFNYPEKTLEGGCSRITLEYCNRLIMEFSKTDISISIAVSSCCTSITQINDMFEQCNYIIRHKYSLGKGKVLHINDIPSSVTTPDINFNNIQREIRFLLNSGSRQEVENYIDILFESIPDNSGEAYIKNLSFCITVFVQIVLSENNEDFKNIFNGKDPVWGKLHNFETIVDIKNWMTNLLVFTNEYLAGKVKNKYKLVAEEVKKYIESHYSSALSIDTIAADLYFSPNYLNYIFKTETGETIFEYISNYRIELAKSYLLDSKTRLYEICEKLGYSHSAYFSNVFRKYTGLTPKEYRERNL
jgi:YesN/AraC family two-component response regulator